MTYLVYPSKAYAENQGASALLGDISRAQWNDWKARFSGTVDQLADIAADENLPTVSANQAMAAVGNSFDNAEKSLGLKQAGLGLSLDGTESEAQRRKFALTKAATQVDAANQARTSTQDMQQAVLAGDMGAYSALNN
ncbi:MAG: hypothetical protein ACPGMR_03180 [Pontibacterium sp.]